MKDEWKADNTVYFPTCYGVVCEDCAFVKPDREDGEDEIMADDIPCENCIPSGYNQPENGAGRVQPENVVGGRVQSS